MVIVFNYREFEDIVEEIPYAEHDTIYLKESVISSRKSRFLKFCDREKVRNGTEPKLHDRTNEQYRRHSSISTKRIQSTSPPQELCN